jgi:raffinose/stachyose/melibiose transport system substrate-binding protein
MKRMLVLLFVSLWAIAGVCAGGQKESGSKGPIEITVFSGHGDLEQGTKVLIAEYLKTHQNVKITDIYNSKDYITQFQSMIASDTLPNIALLPKQSIQDYVENGIFADLSERPVAKVLFDVAKEPNSYKGKLYAVPFHLQGYGLIYNPELFAKAGIKDSPRTLAELKSVAEKLKAAGITPFISQFKEQWACGQYLLFGISPLLAKDPTLVSDINAGKKSFSNPQFAKVFDYIDILKNNAPADPLTYAFGEGAAHFAKGGGAMAIHGDWILRTALDVNPSLQIKISGIPYSDNPDDPKVIVGTADGLGIIKTAKNMPETIEFFDYYTRVESAQTLSAHNHSMVPFKGFDTSKLHPVYTDIMKLIEAGKGVGWEWVKLNPAVVKAVDMSMQAYMSGAMTSEQVLDNAEKAIAVAR